MTKQRKYDIAWFILIVGAPIAVLAYGLSIGFISLEMMATATLVSVGLNLIRGFLGHHQVG